MREELLNSRDSGGLHLNPSAASLYDPIPLPEDVVADVRIFFNAGWKLQFDLMLKPKLQENRQEPLDPTVLLSLLECDLTTPEDIFRELSPTRLTQSASGTWNLKFSAFVNHMFVNDNYTDWKTRFAALETTTSMDEFTTTAGGWNPFNSRISQMTLHLCYNSGSHLPQALVQIGMVHFRLTPSDGLEFVLFSIVALVGIPMLLMMGFRCIASKHAFLRQHIVKCVTTNKLFTQQLIQWLNLHHDA